MDLNYLRDYLNIVKQKSGIDLLNTFEMKYRRTIIRKTVYFINEENSKPEMVQTDYVLFVQEKFTIFYF